MISNGKHILEAIDRGIQLALDNYQDDELNGSLSPINDIIDSEDVIKNKIDLMKNFVDLGLPSGTLWDKCNIGANSEIEYGNYYAWGEVEANKEKYDWSTYKFAWNGSSHNLTKYIFNENYMHYAAEFDDLRQLQDEDDIAYITYKNQHIHMPTVEQIEELLQYTLQRWVMNYNHIEGLNGCMFINTKNISKYIFIPASGYMLQNITNEGSACGIWAASGVSNIRNDLATVLLMSNSLLMRNEGESAEIENRYRYRGYSVRAVYDK